MSPSQVAGLTPLSAAPVGAGAYTAVASFPGSPDYVTAASVADFSIAKATPTIAVSDPGGTFDGSPQQATVMVQSPGGGGDTPATSLEDVSFTITYYGGAGTSGPVLNEAPSTPGTYTAVASFPGSTDFTRPGRRR